MEKFDERGKSFEKKFVRDEELKFKVAAKRKIGRASCRERV